MEIKGLRQKEKKTGPIADDLTVKKITRNIEKIEIISEFSKTT